MGSRKRAAEPIIPGWVWRRRTISAVNLALGALGLLMVAPTVFLPTYAQSVLGLGPIAAGFVLSVMTLSWPISAAFSNRIYTRIGFRLTAVIGIALALVLLLAFPFLPFPGEPWQPALLMLLLGAGLGQAERRQASISGPRRESAHRDPAGLRESLQPIAGAADR